MAIDSYLKLQSAVSFYANRDDLFAAITNFSPAAIDSAVQIAISFAETSVDRDINSRGGIKYAETLTNTLVTAGGIETVTLPTDFRSASAFMLTSNPFQVLGVKSSLDLISLYTSSTITGAPEAYAIVGTNTAYLRPVPDGIYTMRLIYKAKLAPLSSTNTSNWLLVNAPDVYVAATMIELCIMMENDDRLQFWKGYYDQKLDDLMGDDRQTRWTAVDATPRPVGNII